jgi:2-haloacid dehalogenase
MPLIIFDVNGTLLDPSAIDEALGLEAAAGVGLDSLDDAIFQSMTDALVGDYRPFPQYLKAALKRRLALAGHGLARLDDALDVAAQMPPFPDAAEALAKLRAGGLRIAALTNSARAGAERALRNAGLLGFFDELTGSDEVETYKPSPRMYERALAKQDASPADAWMVAAHGWDLVGAKRVGLQTAWISHKEQVLLETVPPPDVSGVSLLDVATAIIEVTTAQTPADRRGQ